jgi:hypothetical protein
LLATQTRNRGPGPSGPLLLRVLLSLGTDPRTTQSLNL